MLADFPTVRQASEAVSAIIGAGIVPAALEMMDRACVAAVEASIYAAGYPTDAAAVLLVELDGGADAVEAEAATVAGDPPGPRRPRGAERLDPRRPRAALAGPQEGVRRDGPDRPRPRGAGRGGPPLRPARHHGPDRGDPRAATGSPSATSSTPATATCIPTSASTGTIRTSPRGCTWPAGRSWRRASRPAGASPASTAWAPTRSTTCRSSSTATPWPRCARCGGPSIPTSAPTRARSCRCTPAASGAPRRRRGPTMSDVIFGRLRALLGTAGVERDAAGLPRATPESADALSLVCRLAHDEGWKIRVEGHGTWLPSDAPADLAVSTRALDQVVSVSPADLVATVEAGTPMERLRRRLADEGMWLALDPPGRPERSLGSVVATGTVGAAAPRLRPGARPHPRLHRRHRRRPAGAGRRAGGEERRRLRPHQAPGRRLRRLRHHRRGAPAAAGAAAGRRHA